MSINPVRVTVVDNGTEWPSTEPTTLTSLEQESRLLLAPLGKFKDNAPGVCRGDLCPLRKNGLNTPKVYSFKIYRLYDI